MMVNQGFGKRHNGTNGVSAAEMLKSFCKWQKLNNQDEPSLEHHDAALLLTRYVSIIVYINLYKPGNHFRGFERFQ